VRGHDWGAATLWQFIVADDGTFTGLTAAVKASWSWVGQLDASWESGHFMSSCDDFRSPVVKVL